MKRAALWLVLISVLLPCLCCAAESADFYCEYTPKTERGTVFYIEVVTRREISATVLELRFDSDIAEYRSVSAAEPTSSVRSACEGGKLQIAFADSGAVKGRFCRVAFKALRSGSCDFVLHTLQAADAEMKLLETTADSTLSVTFGSGDVSAANTSSSAKGRSSASSYRSGRSSVSAQDADGEERYDEPTVFDLRHDRRGTYFLIGAGTVILAVGLVLAGVIVGRRSLKRKGGAAEPASESTELSVTEEPDPEEVPD